MPQITQFLRRAVQINATGVATICGDRRQDWTTFASQTARLAGALTALGYRPGDRIGILALNADRYLECFFGLAWGGFVFVPINTRLAPPEVVYWLTDSGCTGLLVDADFQAMLGEIRQSIPDVRHVIYIGDPPAPDGQLGYDALIAAAQPVADAGRRGDDLAGIFYTGGTTGQSKGVMLSHGLFGRLDRVNQPRRLPGQGRRGFHVAIKIHRAYALHGFNRGFFYGYRHHRPRRKDFTIRRPSSSTRHCPVEKRHISSKALSPDCTYTLSLPPPRLMATSMASTARAFSMV